MLLKEVLDGDNGQKALSSRLGLIKADIIARVKIRESQAELEDLEKKLNNIFYPKDGSSNSIRKDYIENTLGRLTEESIIETFEKFDFENNKGTEYKDSNRMGINTLVKEIQQAERNLTLSLEALSLSDKYETLKDKIEDINGKINAGISIIKNIDKEYKIGELFQKNFFLQGKNFEEARDVVNSLRAFNAVISKILSPQAAGFEFEKALAKVNFIDKAEQIGNDEINKMLGEVLKGNKTVNRGGGIVSYKIDASLANDNDIKENNSFKIVKGNMVITYNPGEARQGKMDVQLNYNSPNPQDYRISAKRWSRGYGDLGETSIDAGISRTAGISVAEAYKLAVLTPSIDQLDLAKDGTPSYISVNEAHKMAKLALKADIAMGLSQGIQEGGAGLANVLVIDTGINIKVINLAQLVLNDNIHLSGYNEGDITSEAINNYSRVKTIIKGRTESYLGLMTSSLQKMKVTINISANKF